MLRVLPPDHRNRTRLGRNCMLGLATLCKSNAATINTRVPLEERSKDTLGGTTFLCVCFEGFEICVGSRTAGTGTRAVYAHAANGSTSPTNSERSLVAAGSTTFVTLACDKNVGSVAST